MSQRLLLDEHYAERIAVALRELGHDVVAVVAETELRGTPDHELFRHAAEHGRRIVTENIQAFRPLLLNAIAARGPVASLLLVPPRRFPRGSSDRTAVIVAAIHAWLERPEALQRPIEDWLN